MVNGKVPLLLALVLILGLCQCASGANVIQVAASGSHSVALKSDGTVWAWGSNDNGQLGDGTTIQRPTPVQVLILTDVIAIAAGEGHTVALKSDGTVWAWGANNYGQLGDGTIIQRNTPVQVSDLTGVTALAAGLVQTVALKSDGTVWAWGYNGQGQLGDGTTTQRTTPVQVSSLTGVTAIAAGGYHTVARKSDGTVWTWGWNNYGQLGDDTTTRRTIPVQVSGLTGVITAIAAGGYHTVALKSDGTVWDWGWNNYGQLGDGTIIQRNTPVQVSALTGVISAIAAGGYHTVALKSDGTVWAWGYNSDNQLGDGTIIQRTTPVQVLGVTAGATVAAGWVHTVALKINGTVRAWGSNSEGELGDGTTTPKTTTVKVVGLDIAGPTGSVVINGGAATTRNGVVTLTLSATDDSGWVTGMCISNDGVFDTEPWEDYATSKTWTLGAGDGTKTVYVRFMDPTENESNTVTDAITYDSGISVSGPSASVTRIGPVSYTVSYTWGDAIITLSPADVTLNKTGTANGSVSVSGSGASRTVTISSISGDGMLSITVAAASASDPDGNVTSAAGPTASFIVDNTPPGISISGPSATVTNTGPVSYTATYTGADSITLSPADVTLNKTGTANGTVSVSGTGAASRAVTISSITGDGTLSIIIAAGSASDMAGNTAPGAGPSASFTVDNTPPEISIGGPSAIVTNTGPVTYTVTYTGADSITLSSADVTLNKTGTANGTKSVSGTGATSRTVTISSITGDGTLSITIASGSASDSAGNAALAAGPSASFTVDNTAPDISISAPSVGITTGGPVTYNVTYTGADSITLSAADVTLNKTGTANGTVLVSGADAASRTVTISSVTGDGALSITIAAGSASDSVGNATLAAGPTASFIVDNTGPGISISDPSASVTSAGPVSYTVSYAGADSITLSSADVTLNKTGTANGTVLVSGADAASRTVAISSITGDGALSITIAAGSASDSVGNAALVAGPSTSFTVDNIPPGISISDPSASVTNTGPVSYTVSYAGAASITLSAADVTLNKTGAANGTVLVSGTGAASRTVTISGITGDGTLSITIAVGSASDSAGNAALAAGPSASFTVDSVAPSVIITSPTSDPSCTRNYSILNLAGTIDDDTGVVGVDWSNDHGGSGTCTGTDSWSASDITLTEGDNVITVTATGSTGKTGSAAIKVTYTPSAPGAAWTGIAMVSLPIIPDTTDPSPVVGFTVNGWHAYNTATGHYAGYADHFSWFEPVSAAPGRGFWAFFPVSDDSAPYGMIPDQTQPVAIRLKPGWNMIGNPFIKPVNWNRNAITVRELSGATHTLAAAKSLVDNYAWGWDAAQGKYVLVYDPILIPSAQGALHPWCGYWIRAFVECDLIFPAP